MSAFHEYPTTPALTAGLAKLQAVLDDDDSVQDEFDTAAQSVFIALWHTKWPITVGQSWSDPTACFLGLYSLRKDGSYLGPGDVTPILARLMRAMQLVTLRQVHLRHNANRNLDRCDLAREFHPWVQGKANTTYSYLYALMQYASAIARLSHSMPRIWWSDNKGYTAMLYRGQAISLDQLCMIVYCLQGKAAELWRQLLFGLNIRVDYNQLLSDNLTETTPGYSFLTDTRNSSFAEAKDLLAENFMRDPTARLDFIANRMFNSIGARQWLQRLAQLEVLLMTGLHLSSGGPARGTELTSMQICNSDTRIRNAFALGPYVSVVRQYTKVSNMTGHDKLIPNAVDSFFADLLIQVHALARPFASYLATRAAADFPNAPLQYRNMLFMDICKPFESHRLTQQLGAFSSSVLGWEMGLNAHRHIYIAFHRKHHDGLNRELESTENDTIDTLQSGHSLATENQVYGLSTSTMDGATEDNLQLYLEASTAWQRTLKVVPAGLGLTYEMSGHAQYDELLAKGTIPPLHAAASASSNASIAAGQTFLAEFKEYNQSAHTTTHTKLNLILTMLETQAIELKTHTQQLRSLEFAVQKYPTAPLYPLDGEELEYVESMLFGFFYYLALIYIFRRSL